MSVDRFVEHRTDFVAVPGGRYVPACSCGFRGAAVWSSVTALAMANAHAREQGAEPLPPYPSFPQTHQRVAGQEDDLP